MKNLTLKRKLIICVILLCLFFIQSCRKDTLLPSKGANSLTIAEAKSYFEANFMATNTIKGKTMYIGETGQPSDIASIQALIVSKQAIWEKAYSRLISTGMAVKIPMDFDNAPQLIISSKTKATMPYAALNYLLMYKDSLQRVHTEWVNLRPDSAWLFGNRSTYTGSIVVKSWKGAFIKKLNYKSNTNSVSTLPTINKLMSTEVPTSNSVLYICVRVKRPIQYCTCNNKNACDYLNCPTNECGRTICGAIDSGCDDCGDGTDPTENPSPGNGESPTPSDGWGSPANPIDYTPTPCTYGPQFVNPDGSMSPGECIPEPGYPPTPDPADNPLTPGQFLISVLDIQPTDVNILNFIANSSNELLLNEMVGYIVANGNTQENRDFLYWGLGYLVSNTSVTNNDFKTQFLTTTAIIADPDANNWTDPDNELLVDPDQTVYQQYQDTQPWPSIARLMDYKLFVPLRNYIDAQGNEKNVNCLILAKEQLGKLGYTCSGYLPGSQTFQTYKESTGVDLARTKQAINYLIDALGKKIPVLIGVDNRVGTPSASNVDNSTDHFIVVVGMGTDFKGKFFQFLDSSTDNYSKGASENNKLYYDPISGKISGKTMSGYGSYAGFYDYKVTQVRKSIKK